MAIAITGKYLDNVEGHCSCTINLKSISTLPYECIIDIAELASGGFYGYTAGFLLRVMTQWQKSDYDHVRILHHSIVSSKVEYHTPEPFFGALYVTHTANGNNASIERLFSKTVLSYIEEFICTCIYLLITKLPLHP